MPLIRGLKMPIFKRYKSSNLALKKDTQAGGFSPDLTISMLKNLVLKTKILIGLFSLIFIGQVILISTLLIMQCSALQNIPKKLMVFGPLFIFTAALLESLYLSYLNKQIKNSSAPKPSFTYIIAFTEISFPAIVLLIVVTMAGNNLIIPASEILSSPPFILYFILIILSSLHLDKKLCAFSGLIAGVQYIFVCIYFKNMYNLETLLVPNIVAKGILIFVCGLSAGFVSDKIKQALVEALHAQDSLINKLDGLVKEKTKEVTLQKIEIEKQHSELQDKNKEIIDSIHYAKRIQQAFMPSDKYFSKHVNNKKN
jgi:adenylate cyclase